LPRFHQGERGGAFQPPSLLASDTTNSMNPVNTIDSMNPNSPTNPIRKVFEDLLVALREACLEVYGDRLKSLCVFGSVAGGIMRPDSDIDLLCVCDPLPMGRMARVLEFEAVDALCERPLKQGLRQGVNTTFSPLIKTPEEVRQGSPVFLDMTETVRILFDREGFLEGYLGALKDKLRRLGARKVMYGGGYYWILKPDIAPGEEISL
jgi:predicted nucleotidyltransferase